MSGSAGERVTGPVVCECASTSVTEMIAKRGSTASSKVSCTLAGDVLRKPLALGEVWTRYACAAAAAGTTSARTAAAAATVRRTRDRHVRLRPPFERSARPPSSTPIAPTTSAISDSVDELPPPSESATLIVGAGSAPVSGSVQLTISPSE